MLNVVAILGRLVADPELRQTPAGVAVCRFTVAVDRSFVRQGEQRQADFIDVVAWRQQAEFVAKYFRKGNMIGVDGSLRTGSYKDNNGSTRKTVEITANNVSFAGSKNQSPGGAAQAAPLQTYAQGAADDFAEISDEEDLPF